MPRKSQTTVPAKEERNEQNNFGFATHQKIKFTNDEYGELEIMLPIKVSMKEQQDEIKSQDDYKVNVKTTKMRGRPKKKIIQQVEQEEQEEEAEEEEEEREDSRHWNASFEPTPQLIYKTGDSGHTTTQARRGRGRPRKVA